MILDTLAQSGTPETSKYARKPIVIVKGKGTEIVNEVLRSRTKRKIITQKLMLCLIDVSKRKGNIDRIQTYWNTWHCQNHLFSNGARLYGNYCKNRFCALCAGIKKAEIINRYLPFLKTWDNPQFVTLTITTVYAYQLENRINEMFRAFNKIKDKYRKWHVKGKSIKLIGVKSLECNFNPVKRWYNPHFHIIVPNKPTANLLVQEWRKYWGYERAGIKGQRIIEITDTEECLIEVVKYCSKVFTNPRMEKRSAKKIRPYIYVSAFDNIIWAMKKHRVFERFGFNLPKRQIVKRKTTELMDYVEWLYSHFHGDWISADTEAKLSGYKLTSELANLLENNIDMELE